MISKKWMPWWAWAWPVAGAILLALSFQMTINPLSAAVIGAAIIAVVFAAVYHAEVIAHKLGEPFGTLVIALSVTVIEVALIVSMMFQNKAGNETLARDTVFAAVMIICNGLVGMCLLAGGMKHFVQGFHLKGALAALAVLVPLTIISLVLPNFTTSESGSAFNPAQLVFAGAASLVLYGAFTFIQTVRHRDYFLPAENVANEDNHAPPPPSENMFLSLALLIFALITVVGLAKAASPMVELGVTTLGAPKALVGILIATVVLMPEGLAAYKAARADRIQTSMNLALGSALATIGLTIPAVVAVALLLDKPLVMGLGGKETVLLAMTLLVSTLTVATGRTTILQGVVHLVIFAAFLFFTTVP